ncbi:hypothetical protein ABW636_16855 [Aquimarina sp. 2201CG1-2-11]|uniref:hypothetical protein n=1 Tax=Aquimarina discodermiae TaxID=3231043 RepID=UPI0034635768
MGTHNLGIDKGSAKIYVQIKEGILTWWIDIYSDVKEIEDIDWGVQLYCEDLRLELKHWRDLGTVKIEFEDCWDEEIDDNIAGIYVFEHEDVKNTTIEMKAIKDNFFQIEWKGIGLVSGEEYEIFVFTEIEFTEIVSWSLNLEESNQWFSKYFNLEDYHIGDPEITNHHNGKDIGRIIYTPKLNML